MKIWSQSCSPLHEQSRGDYQASLKKHVKEIARPDTVVEFRGVDFQIPGTTTSFSGQDVCSWQAVRNAIQAEREGFDAFMLASTFDNGYYGVKEMINIPAVFMTEACLHMACILGNKFSFLSISNEMVLRYGEIVKRYGLEGHLVPGESINMPYSTIWAKTSIFKQDPKQHVDSLVKSMEKMVEHGADVILPAPVPLSQYLIDQGIREVKGAQVMDVYGVTLKMAEAMVDMKKAGIDRCKHGLFTAAPQDIMPALRKLYQVKWEKP